MMKKILIFFLTAAFIAPAGVLMSQLNELDLGSIHFPKDFLHSQQHYDKGTYKVEMVTRDGQHYFIVSDREGNPLFEELATIKPYEGKYKNFKYRVKKELLKKYEYFRIKITTPEELIMAYFLVDKEK